VAINPVKTPFSNMSFTPDVPSGALGPQEYNAGRNVVTDVRGIKKVPGEETILSGINGNVIYVTSNFRQNVYNFVVATDNGSWYVIDTGGVSNVTPLTSNYSGNTYSISTAITDSWNGDVLFLNDNKNPPMYFLPTDQEIRLYDTPYNDQTPNTYVWNYYLSSLGWQNLRAGFLRVYSAPNVGAVLICGNLTYEIGGTVYNLPTTVRWSQAFGLNSGPTTWAPTATNIANEVDVPVRGPLIDGFSLQGNFYAMSYWDTVVFSPIAYTTTAAPVFGIRLLNQGRGVLNENCWANTDNLVFGIDARDVWRFDGGTFTPVGNQRVKNYIYDNIDPANYNQVFMINNSAAYQIEIYYPDLNSTGFCNKMISYRYDLDIWNPPKDVERAVEATEAPVYTANVPNIASRTIVYARGGGASSNAQPLVQTGIGNAFVGNTTIDCEFRRDNINFSQPYSAKVQIHRVLPMVTGTGNLTVTVGGSNSMGQTATFKPAVNMPIDTDNPWIQVNQNDVRVTSIKFGSNNATDTWEVTQAEWQITVVEETR